MNETLKFLFNRIKQSSLPVCGGSFFRQKPNIHIECSNEDHFFMIILFERALVKKT